MRLFQVDSSIPEDVLQFIETNREKECSFDDFKKNFTNQLSSHNHTFENLYLYFHLEKFIQKKRVITYPNAIFIVDNRRYKVFINDNSDFLQGLDFTPLQTSRKKFIFYSSDIQNVSRELFDYSKSKELLYDIDYCLDEQAFFEKYKGEPHKKIKKKIYNRLQYPLTYLSKLDFKAEDITQDNLHEALQVHQEWVEWKQNNPEVFQMMFSSNRYNKALEKMFSLDEIKREDFLAKIFYLDGRPVAVRQILIKGDRSFDIGFFSLYFELPSNFVNYLNTLCLFYLQRLGVKVHNTGMCFERRNTVSKQHFPSIENIIYTYKLKSI